MKNLKNCTNVYIGGSLKPTFYYFGVYDNVFFVLSYSYIGSKINSRAEVITICRQDLYAEFNLGNYIETS